MPPYEVAEGLACAGVAKLTKAGAICKQLVRFEKWRTETKKLQQVD